MTESAPPADTSAADTSAADTSAADTSAADTTPSLPAFDHKPEGVPPPKRKRWLGPSLLLFGSLGTLFQMSLERQLPRGSLWGALGVFVAALGVLELLGLLRAQPDDPSLMSTAFAAQPGEPRWMAPIACGSASFLALLGGALWFGFAGLPWVITLALLLLAPSMLRRPALFVFVVGSLLMLPLLGDYGLWDPWETHYGEVSREILARDDWITLWWAQDEWFRSKPIFIFWSEALTWSALGIPFAADSNPAHAEWALRLPVFVLSMGALLSSHAAIARIFGRRAGVLSALVLATTPYFFFLSHQAITDMPFVATMTIALALLLIGLEEPDDRQVLRLRAGPFQLSWQSVVIAALVGIALPQALYLITRNLTFVLDGSPGFWLHRDSFQFGSAGNDAIPGNGAMRTRAPYLIGLATQPMVQGILWLLGLLGLVWMLRTERRTQQLAMFGFYLFCSFAWMAKGIPGFALPGLIAALYLLATGRFSRLRAGRLRIAAGALTIAVTGLPWYVAMYGRLGPFFTDRLLIHDHINRLASGVHGDTGSIQYFLGQLGYGVFPWLGLAPVAFANFLTLSRTDTPEDLSRRRSMILLAMWWMASFALFNGMITKFHHYIFPVVPPMAMSIGILLDRMLGADPAGEVPARKLFSMALSALAPVPIVLGAAGLWGDVRGIVPIYVPAEQRATWVQMHPWGSGSCVALIGVGLALFLVATSLSRMHGQAPERRPQDAAFSVALIASAAILAFSGRDLSWTTTARPLGHERLLDLFVYNYQRPFPDHLDYRPILTGFTIALVALTLAAAIHALRKPALYALLACALWFGAWSLDVYMIDLSPHWGQRELIRRYYAQRQSHKEPLIAWQMNWKGENFYTGNRVHVFVQLDNKEVTKWVEKNKGSRAYFVFEHSRLTNFKRMMGAREVRELSTSRENNKFMLVRADL